MENEILKAKFEEACKKLAEKGIEGSTDKEVTLVCFGTLMFNGIDSLEKSVNKLRGSLTKAMWTVVGVGVSALIAIVIQLLVG